MQKIKTVNISGKEYVPVDERIRLFHEACPNGSISTSMQYFESYVRCEAIAVPDCEKPDRRFLGHSEEDRKQGRINSTNATENCETSAVGRALGMLGIGLIGSVASADEVQGALNKAPAAKGTVYYPPKPAAAPGTTSAGNPRGTMTEAQNAKIYAMLGELKVEKDKADAWVAKVVPGKARISSLDVGEAATVIEHLQLKLDKAKPAETEAVNWLEAARSCGGAAEAKDIVANMKAAGASDARIAAVQGVLKSKGY